MDNYYLKRPNQDIFAQRMIPRPSSFNLKCRKLINYYPKTTKFSQSTMNGFYSTKNKYSNINNNITSSQNFNLFSVKPQTPKMRKISRIKPQSASYKKSLPDVSGYLNRSMYSNNCLETEKLYQETYQIKKLVKQLQRQLDKITKENHKKDRQLNAKENLINDIIIHNNNMQLNNEEDDKNNYNYNFLEIKFNKPNTAMGILIFKIKREIKTIINEINQENIKLENLKKSLYLSKTKELNIESFLYNEQINKINLLIGNALEIKEQNDIKLEEFESLNQNLERQEIIIDNLTRDNIALESQQEFLNIKLEKLQNDVKAKIEKAKKNDNELNILSLKNKNLSNDEIIKKQIFTTKIDGIPISMKSLYTGKVSSLKKSINFYKRQIKYTEDILNKLKEQKKKLIDSNKSFDQKIKIDSKFIDNTSQIKTYQRPKTSKVDLRTVNNQDNIEKLRKEYKKAREEELNFEKKANIYYDKLKEININYEEKEKENEKKVEEDKKAQNQLEFGIDETNPYYTENEENIPESNIKFTSQQFNQFTYILFKNFEAKYIIGKEAKDKVINPFSEIIKKNNYNRLNYPSNEFDEVVEHFTKIIMSVLNTENEYNHTLAKIFIGALLYNSECDINKLIEYFSILFSYTKDYSKEEKKYIEKLKTKYKKETKKLFECITSYILNDLTASPYFSLFKMKDLLDNNEINLKDKYIEFLFYFLKKFNDPEAKLEDLKYSLLNEIVPLGDTTVHSKAFVNKEKEEDNENIDLDNLDHINEKKEIFNNDIINIEENKEINFDLDKNKENNKTEKSNQNKEENIFEKNKKKNKNSQENSSVNKAKQESKKDNSTPKENISDKNVRKRLNADLFDNNGKIENNDSQNNGSTINNMAKINDIEDNKENNDSDYLGENSKDMKINNIIGEGGKEKENGDKNKNIQNKNEDIKDNINQIDDTEENKNNILNKTPKEKTNSQQISDNNKEGKKTPPSVKKYQEDEIAKKTDSKPTDENEKNNISNNKTDGEKNKTNENEDDSVTEITNEEFIKQIRDSLSSILNALENNSLEFMNFIEDSVKKIKIEDEEYDYINIEDLNEKLVGIDVVLSDLQLSCLCSKYSLPNELRLINVKIFEKNLKEFKEGNYKL
jgi:hypothetical protein